MLMSKVKQKLVPELRFPTFEKSDNWKDVKLIDVTDKNKKWSFTGGPFGSNLKSSDYVEGDEGVRIIQLQNIGDGEFKNDYKIYTSKEKADELLSCNIYPGDIIMSKMGDPVGRACLIPDFHNRYVMSSDGIRIVVDENKYDKYFIYLVINSKIFRSKVENSSTGSTRKRIGLVDLKKLTLTIPKDKDEQEKIANCLSSLDNLITAETKKLDHLKDHKKGLLQQLFPQERETKPQYRFPEFQKDGDWNRVSLGDLVEIKGRIGYRGYTRKDIVEKGKGAITLSPSNFDENGKLNFENSTYITWKKYNESPEIMLEEGQTVLVKTASVGKSAYVSSLTEKTTVNPQIVVLKPLNIDSKFLAYTVFHNYIQNQIKNSIGAGAIPNMSQASIAKLEVILPMDEERKEQQKIANCLSSVDDLIEGQSKKIENLKNHKKGLMQQLFPNVNNL